MKKSGESIRRELDLRLGKNIDRKSDREKKKSSANPGRWEVWMPHSERISVKLNLNPDGDMCG